MTNSNCINQPQGGGGDAIIHRKVDNCVDLRAKPHSHTLEYTLLGGGFLLQKILAGGVKEKKKKRKNPESY